MIMLSTKFDTAKPTVASTETTAAESAVAHVTVNLQSTIGQTIQ